MTQFIHSIITFDPVAFVTAVGYIGIAIILFSESGILLGIFLPGDSLLFAAGLLSAQGMFNPFWLLAITAVSAIVGDSTGYWIGKRGGTALLHAYPRLIKKEYITRTELFYARWGGYSILLARFVPIVRTIVPTLAGVGKMNYVKFVQYNIVGGVLWVSLIITISYSLGKYIPNIQHYILPITLIVILISFIPFLLRFIKQRIQQKTVTE